MSEMLVSMMLCSRGRPSGMDKCVRSFYSDATSDNWEFLIWVDDDDLPSVQMAKMLSMEFPRCRYFVGPKLGYDLIDRGYYTMMAYHSSAVWVMILNDDMHVKGDWYKALDAVPKERVFCHPGIHGLGTSEYPNDPRSGSPVFLRNCWLEAGWLTIPKGADYCLSAKLEEMGWQCHFLEGVKVQHDHKRQG